MKNVIVFFCDINGTINGKLENEEIDYINLNKLLNIICMNNNCEILFTLLSSESKEELCSVLKKLKKYLNNDIYFDKQFYENGFIKENASSEIISGKLDQMIYFLKEIKEHVNILGVYYADDCTFLQDLISEYIEFNNIDIPFKQIIPIKNNGLKEVNKILSKNLNI